MKSKESSELVSRY